MSRCWFTHDIQAYLTAKPRDIKLPLASSITDTPPFVTTDDADFGTTCPNFEEMGECHLGLKCRFLGAHTCVDDSGEVTLITDDEKKSRIATTNAELNQVSSETLKLLRQNKVCS